MTENPLYNQNDITKAFEMLFRSLIRAVTTGLPEAAIWEMRLISPA